MTISSICRKYLRRLAPVLFWLAVWQGVSMLVGLDLLVPAPLSVAARLAALGAEKGFWLSVGYSLARVVAGMAAGALLGCALAVLTWRIPVADLFLSPALRFIRAVPVVSFILLILLWVARDLVPAIITALMVLPVVWEGTMRGLHQTDPALVEFARAYRLPPLRRGLLIYLPSALPFLFPALTTGMGLAWKSGIAAEVLCQPVRAAGTEIHRARLMLETPDLFAWTLVVVCLSLLLEGVLRAVFARVKRRWPV